MTKKTLLITVFLWQILLHPTTTVCSHVSIRTFNTTLPTSNPITVEAEVRDNTREECDETQHTSFEEIDKKGCNSPWSYSDNGTCECGKIPHNILSCNIGDISTIKRCYCVTYNESEAIMEAGNCLFTCDVSNDKYRGYLPLPRNNTELNEFICGELHRSGTLCGECMHNYFPQVYSFNIDCVKCPGGKDNWWKFVLTAFLPLTAFFFMVLFFRINIASSHLHGIVFYSQMVSMPALLRSIIVTIRSFPTVETALRIGAIFYGVWNLDFFRSLDLQICLGTDTLQTLALDIVVGVYPLLLMVLTYLLIKLYDRNFRPLVILWKPFSLLFSYCKRRWNVRRSLTDAFATFFLLSNVKFQSTLFDMLIPIKVLQLNSTGHLTYSWRLYYDATVPYFGQRHLPYAILALVVLVVFVLLPVLLLILYPFRWFHNHLNLFPVRLYIFMDSFQGCYKDGTETGTRDCRWFASVFFLLRLTLILISACTLNWTYFPLAVIALVFTAFLYILVQPFKAHLRNLTYINVIFILHLAMTNASILGVTVSHLRRHELGKKVYIFIGTLTAVLPLLYTTATILHHMYRHRRSAMDTFRRLCIWRRGYELLE